MPHNTRDLCTECTHRIFLFSLLIMHAVICSLNAYSSTVTKPALIKGLLSLHLFPPVFIFPLCWRALVQLSNLCLSLCRLPSHLFPSFIRNKVTRLQPSCANPNLTLIFKCASVCARTHPRPVYYEQLSMKKVRSGLLM